MDDEQTFAERIAAPLRAPEQVEATFTTRVMASVWNVAASAPLAPVAPTTPPVHEREPVRGRLRPNGAHLPPQRKWWLRSFTLQITPLSAFALAASIVGVVVLSSVVLRRTASAPPPGQTVAVAGKAAVEPRHDTTYVVRFILVAPSASHVALVGDFNNWRRNATPLTTTGRRGAWTVSVALAPGQHEYAFIVDDTHWIADPHAALTVADEFGTESSIVSVGSRGPSPTI